MKRTMTDKERYKALTEICLAYARRLYFTDSPKTRESYEKYKAERDELRKKLYNC